MRILQASFFWKNDQPGGLGFTLGPPGFSSEELTEMFAGEHVKQYMRDSDAALGSKLVETYLAQLGAIAVGAKVAPMPMEHVILAALNIMWLSERGFIPNDEFNGAQFVQARGL